MIVLPILRATLGSNSAPSRGASPPRTSRILDFPLPLKRRPARVTWRAVEEFAVAVEGKSEARSGEGEVGKGTFIVGRYLDSRVGTLDPLCACPGMRLCLLAEKIF